MFLVRIRTGSSQHAPFKQSSAFATPKVHAILVPHEPSWPTLIGASIKGRACKLPASVKLKTSGALRAEKPQLGLIKRTILGHAAATATDTIRSPGHAFACVGFKFSCRNHGYYCLKCHLRLRVAEFDGLFWLEALVFRPGIGSVALGLQCPSINGKSNCELQRCYQ